MRPVPFFLSIALAGTASAEPDAGDVLAATRIRGGVAVCIGTTDGELERELAATGRFLIHGLAVDPAAVPGARAAIAGRGLSGLAVVDPVRAPLRRLPHADSLVSLLVADLDALGETAPSPGEIERVLAPGGAVFAAVGAGGTLPMRGTVAARLDAIVALDLDTGRELWRNRELAGSYVLRLVHHDGLLPVAYFTGRDRKGREGAEPLSGYGHRFGVAAIRAADGSTAWNQREQKSVGGHYAVTFCRDGSAYVACERFIGYDLATGALEAGLPQRTFVNACAETRATPRWVLYGMSFAGLNGRVSPRAVARSTCDTGVFPANGLVYCSPPLCACLDVVAGYTATAAEPPPEPIALGERLACAAWAPRDAAGDPAGGDSAGDDAYDDERDGPWPAPGEWPIHRADPLRSASTPAAVPLELEMLWRVQVDEHPDVTAADDWREAEAPPGPVTAPTAAGGRIFVAAAHRHRLEAREAGTGELAWSFTAGGRIDSPPTVCRGLCLLGSRDGRVYALRASDGGLAWSFLAAPVEKRIVSCGQLESPWPVAGSVMVHDGVRYAEVTADAIAFTSGALYCVDGRRPGKGGGLGQLARVPLEEDGSVGSEPVWKASIRHHDGSRERSDFEVLSLVVAADRLFLAGHMRDRAESAIHAHSAADGTKLAQWALPARPIRDGLIAAGGRLHVTLEDGSLVCLGRR